MKAWVKIPARLLADIRHDLDRRHAFAYERVGFITAGAVLRDNGDLVLFAREYQPVEDDDYINDPSVGAQIGSEAMRKGLQLAYRPRSALLHVHTHGGSGRPEFSGVDLKSGGEFVPGFFNAISRLPHGIIVLSDDSASGLLWLGPKRRPTYIAGFTAIGAPQQKFGTRP